MPPPLVPGPGELREQPDADQGAAFDQHVQQHEHQGQDGDQGEQTGDQSEKGVPAVAREFWLPEQRLPVEQLVCGGVSHGWCSVLQAEAFDDPLGKDVHHQGEHHQDQGRVHQ